MSLLQRSTEGADVSTGVSFSHKGSFQNTSTFIYNVYKAKVNMKSKKYLRKSVKNITNITYKIYDLKIIKYVAELTSS